MLCCVVDDDGDGDDDDGGDDDVGHWQIGMVKTWKLPPPRDGRKPLEALKLAEDQLDLGICIGLVCGNGLTKQMQNEMGVYYDKS